jgi:hypothetical protein
MDCEESTVYFILHGHFFMDRCWQPGPGGPILNLTHEEHFNGGRKTEIPTIQIHVQGLELEAELTDTGCARKIHEALPIEGTGNTWGDEIYFDIGVECELDETASEVVELGDIGYWPSGRAICLFYGPAPLSHGDEIRPASPVNIIGRILGDPTILRQVRSGSGVMISSG